MDVVLTKKLKMIFESTRGGFVLITVFVLVVGCKENEIPSFVNGMIESHEESDIRAIWSFRFNGETVYYVQSGCCDMYNDLYNALGESICSPDGGFTGSGDGKCPKFWDSAKRRAVVWERGQLPSHDQH